MTEPFIGQIMAAGFNFAPRGWATCEGQLLAISTNTALFSLLGTTFGGDGRTTFGLPDLRGRHIIGQGRSTASGHTYVWGQKGGTESVTLTVSQMPSHSHPAQLKANQSFSGVNDPSGAYLGGGDAPIYSSVAPDVSMNVNSIAIGNTGGNQPFYVLNPYLCLYYCIALVGIYPSRG